MLFTYTPMFGKRQARIIAGGEFIKNINYQNTYNTTTTGGLGTTKTDLELQPFMSSFFAELNLQMDKYVTVTAGASANYNYFDVMDNRVSTASPLYVNNSGIKHFTPLIATHVALNRNFGKHNLYLNYNESYSLPTYDQVFISRLGRVNDTVQAEKIACFEVGLKGNMFNNAFNYQFAFYTLELTNRLTPQTVFAAGAVPTYVFYTNLYNARNNGVEFSGNYTYKPEGKNTFLSAGRLFVNYTYNNFNNADYKSDNNNNAFTKDYTDLAISGVPRHVINFGFDLILNAGLYFSLTHYATDRIPVNLAATSYAPAYNLSSFKAGWKLMNSNEYKRKQWHIDVFAGIDNIFNNANQQMLFVNAVSTATNQLPKYFNPGNPNATFYSGLNITYSF